MWTVSISASALLIKSHVEGPDNVYENYRQESTDH